MGRALAAVLSRRRSRVRRGRRRPGRAHHPARVGGSRGGRSTGPRTASRPCSPPRSPTSRPSRSAGTSSAWTSPEPAFAAGHSMGQYSALVAAGALEPGGRRPPGADPGPADAGFRCGPRGSNGGASSASTTTRLPELVAQAGEHGIFGVANRNSPGQVPWSAASVPAVEAALGDREELLGAKARDRAAGLRRRALAR